MNRVIAAACLWLACRVRLPGRSPRPRRDRSQPALSEQYFLDRASESAKSGDLDAAAQFFQSAIIYAPLDPVPYHRLGQLYAQSGQRELAQQYFGLALNVEPAYAPGAAKASPCWTSRPATGQGPKRSTIFCCAPAEPPAPRPPRSNGP